MNTDDPKKGQTLFKEEKVRVVPDVEKRQY